MEWKVLEEFKETAPDESIFLNLTPEEITLLFYVLALAISQPLTIDELNVLANGLFETAQIMFVIAAQRSLLNDVIIAQQEKAVVEEEKKTAHTLEYEVKKLQKQIEYLQKQINELKG